MYTVLGGQQSGCSESAWTTAVALAFLLLVLPNLKDSWVMVAQKAEKWLHSQQLTDESKTKGDADKYVKIKLDI